MSRHDEASASSVVWVQTYSVHIFWHVVLGAAPADGFSVDNYVADKQILVWRLAMEHLKYVLNIDVNVCIALKDEPVRDEREEGGQV